MDPIDSEECNGFTRKGHNGFPMGPMDSEGSMNRPNGLKGVQWTKMDLRVPSGSNGVRGLQ